MYLCQQNNKKVCYLKYNAAYLFYYLKTFPFIQPRFISWEFYKTD